MQSSDNPLYTTKQFYGESTTASRGNTAGGMFSDSKEFSQRRNGGGLTFPSQDAKRGPPVDPRGMPSTSGAAGGQTAFRVTAKPMVPKF
jgi:hypothetical protein